MKRWPVPIFCAINLDEVLYWDQKFLLGTFMSGVVR